MQLGIDNRVGSIEVGKDADVVIWNQHPLSTYAIVDRVYIDGQSYYDRQDDEKRSTELAKEKETLINAERGERRVRRRPKRRRRATRGHRPAAERGRLAPSKARRGQRSTAGWPVRAADRRRNDCAHEPGSRRAASSRSPTPGSSRSRSPPIERGTIVIRDGIIEAVGANVSVPVRRPRHRRGRRGACIPGFINAQTTIGLEDPGAGGFGDANEILDFNPQLRPHVAFHNDSDAIPVARANGLTTVALTPGGGLLGGQAAVMDLDGWTWEESTVAPSVGVTFQFPRIGGGGRRRWRRTRRTAPDRAYDELKKERDAQLDRVARLLDDARAYAKAAAPNRRRDLMLEALVPIVDKRQPLITRVDTELEIRDAVAFADRVGVRIVIAAPAAKRRWPRRSSRRKAFR